MNIRALVLSVILLPGCCVLWAQSDTADWEKAAGVEMSFDVTSVKQNKSGLPPFGDKPKANFSFGADDAYTPDRGYLSVRNFGTMGFIGFAYKLSTAEWVIVNAQLPKWAKEERFDVEARGPSTATKDQMRLMMQSLLADRFKLAVHWETHEGPVYALVLAKDGKMGPQLHSYADDPPCVAANPRSSPRHLKLKVGEFPATCFAVDAIASHPDPNGIWAIGSRNVSVQQIANDLLGIPGSNLDRPVVDRTGLSGNFDFLVRIAVKWPSGLPNAEGDDSGPHFPEVLSDQLGLKLKRATAPIDKLVIDYIEEPSPN